MASTINFDCPDTVTAMDQAKTENDVVELFNAFLASSAGDTKEIRLRRDQHLAFLTKGLKELPAQMSGLDASRPWFVYWISHALEVLDEYDEDFWPPRAASFLAHCQDPEGGFGGGPMQMPHLAPTYAAVSALMIAGTEQAYKAVNRETMYKFLMQMKRPEGGFMMHAEGEVDMRGTYCALAVASMLQILTDELVEGIPEYVRRCQTFEGGIAGEEGLEAHGGYSYCGLAALCIIGKASALDLDAFLHWAVHRQMTLEGGFQGRTNKLVDSCYSFWQGALFPLLHEAFRDYDKCQVLPSKHMWFMPRPLQMYVLLACQTETRGGVRDKPGKNPDYYHTCYALSGLAVSQHTLDGELIVGDSKNRLHPTDPFYNIAIEKAERKCAYFDALPPLVVDGRSHPSREGSGPRVWRRRRLEKLQ
mmetsp:Transcript_154/g.345  ORF Transcript_154/g.345 Transcript_154/m.345 type:complete len:419 (+) Transcript_154:97-1353(+)